jgi:hypothetical protein
MFYKHYIKQTIYYMTCFQSVHSPPRHVVVVVVVVVVCDRGCGRVWLWLWRGWTSCQCVDGLVGCVDGLVGCVEGLLSGGASDRVVSSYEAEGSRGHGRGRGSRGRGRAWAWLDILSMAS